MDSFNNNFSELLAAFSSEDSMTILTAFLGTLLIGWITRYFWDRWKIKSLEETLEKREQEKVHFKGQWEKLQEQYALQEADLKKANLELSDKTVSLEASDAEKRTLSSRLNATLVDLDKSKEEFQEASNRMEDLNDQILGLRTKNAQLSTEMEQKTSLSGQYAISQNNPEYQQEIADLSAENTLLKNSIAQLKADNTAEGTAGATLRIAELEKENETLKTSLAAGVAVGGAAAVGSSEDTTALKAKLEALEAEKEKIEDYHAEIAQLESGNEALSTTIATLLEENELLKDQVETLPQYESGNEALNNSLHTLISENEDLKDNAAAVAQYEAGNEVLNATIAELLEKNETLEEQLAEQTKNNIEWSINDEVNLEETEETVEMDVEEAKATFRAAIGDQIARATSEERDDLKQINGIGPFIEEKLNDLGIYTFEQISQLDEDLVNTLTTGIEFFPGRIDRDDWVGQADRLFYTKGNAPQEMNTSSSKIMTRRYATATEKIEVNSAPTPNNFAATSRSMTSVKPDDLKKIEGIGPKISGIMNEAGIYTFANLSQTPVDRLRTILANAGNRYKIHDPQTWPQQAALAAAGEWDKLKELQDYLDGGRDVAKG